MRMTVDGADFIETDEESERADVQKTTNMLQLGLKDNFPASSNLGEASQALFADGQQGWGLKFDIGVHKVFFSIFV